MVDKSGSDFSPNSDSDNASTLPRQITLESLHIAVVLATYNNNNNKKHYHQKLQFAKASVNSSKPQTLSPKRRTKSYNLPFFLARSLDRKNSRCLPRRQPARHQERLSQKRESLLRSHQDVAIVQSLEVS